MNSLAWCQIGSSGAASRNSWPSPLQHRTDANGPGDFQRTTPTCDETDALPVTIQPRNFGWWLKDDDPRNEMHKLALDSPLDDPLTLSSKVGTSRCNVPAERSRGGIGAARKLASKLAEAVAPTLRWATGTAQRAVPTQNWLRQGGDAQSRTNYAWNPETGGKLSTRNIQTFLPHLQWHINIPEPKRSGHPLRTVNRHHQRRGLAQYTPALRQP